MLGTGDNPGIMALALNEIFALVRKGAENSTYTVCMSYLEVISISLLHMSTEYQSCILVM